MGANGSPPEANWIDDLLAQHEAGLLRYAHRITRDWERAREVVQDTFLKLTQQSRSDVDGHAVQWLYTVCRNRALDVRRKEQRMAAVTEHVTFDKPDNRASPSQVVEQRETAGQVVEWLDELPENQQEVVRLRFQSGLSYREIGDVTGLTVSNVGFLLHQGMTALRERMRRTEAASAYPRLARNSDGS